MINCIYASFKIFSVLTTITFKICLAALKLCWKNCSLLMQPFVAVIFISNIISVLGRLGRGVYNLIRDHSLWPYQFLQHFSLLFSLNLQSHVNFIKYFVISLEPQLSISQNPTQFMLLQEELCFRKITQLAPKKVTTVTTTGVAIPAIASA